MTITIIVPIYKDWETLQLCIRSLIRYVPDSVSVLLINDNSEEADFLESNILLLINGYLNFSYYRNTENLGFVKTCNKAVFELDKTENDVLLLNSDTEVTEGFLEELHSILNSHHQHGVVCPRSNNATILTYLLFQMNETKDLSTEEQFKLFKETSILLPRFHVIPTAVGFCMLIKRSLIINFGLFDEIYDKGYNEENDFCMRISQYGYSTISANHAFVFHYESKSFGHKERLIRDKKNSKILLKRYPYYLQRIRNYIKSETPPIETFIPSLIGKPKILYCLYEAKPYHDGTTTYGLKLLEAFYSLFHSKYEITVLVHQNVRMFHKLDALYPLIIGPDQLLKKYSLVFSPSQIFNWKHLKIHLQHGLKSVFTLQDIIIFRCPQLLFNNQKIIRIFQNAFRYADGIITISDFVKKDAENYFNTSALNGFSEKVTTVHHGIHLQDKGTQPEGRINLFEDYILVIGNHFIHKSMNLTYEVLKKSDLGKNYIFLGLSPTFTYAANFKFINSGNLTEEFIHNLYTHAEAVIFPSQYEGFGLPVIETLSHSKSLFIFKNEINEEVIHSVKNSGGSHITFFKYFKDLPELIRKNEGRLIENQASYRSWSDVAIDTEKIFNNIIAQPINKGLIDEKALLMQTLYDIGSSIVPNPAFISEDMGIYYKLKKIAEYFQISTAYKLLKQIKHQWFKS